MNIDLALALAEPLVFSAEGCRLTAYLDTLADPPKWTIGHGNTWVDGRPVEHGMTCTRAQADAWAQTDLRKVATQVMLLVTVTIDEHQLAALTSLAYNIGITRFHTSSVLEALNMASSEGRVDHTMYRRAADRFLEYDEAGGHKVDGLLERRGRERALFLTGTGLTGSQPSAVPHVTVASKGPAPVHEAPAQPPHPAPKEPTTEQLNESELDKLESGRRLTGHQSPSESDPPPPSAA